MKHPNTLLLIGLLAACKTTSSSRPAADLAAQGSSDPLASCYTSDDINQVGQGSDAALNALYHTIADSLKSYTGQTTTPTCGQLTDHMKSGNPVYLSLRDVNIGEHAYGIFNHLCSHFFDSQAATTNIIGLDLSGASLTDPFLLFSNNWNSLNTSQGGTANTCPQRLGQTLVFLDISRNQLGVQPITFLLPQNGSGSGTTSPLMMVNMSDNAFSGGSDSIQGASASLNFLDSFPNLIYLNAARNHFQALQNGSAPVLNLKVADFSCQTQRDGSPYSFVFNFDVSIASDPTQQTSVIDMAHLDLACGKMGTASKAYRLGHIGSLNYSRGGGYNVVQDTLIANADIINASGWGGNLAVSSVASVKQPQYVASDTCNGLGTQCTTSVPEPFPRGGCDFLNIMNSLSGAPQPSDFDPTSLLSLVPGGPKVDPGMSYSDYQTLLNSSLAQYRAICNGAA